MLSEDTEKRVCRGHQLSGESVATKLQTSHDIRLALLITVCRFALCAIKSVKCSGAAQKNLVDVAALFLEKDLIDDWLSVEHVSLINVSYFITMFPYFLDFCC